MADGSTSVVAQPASGQSTIAAAMPYFSRAGNVPVAEQAGPRKQDPTRSKALIVLTWLRVNIERMVKLHAIEKTQLPTISALVNDLVGGYSGIDKIDRTVLPLPYCQLLKMFELFFVFTLPFVLAPALAGWTPVVAAMTAIGFFGLDQVGIEMEGPFGVDHNDFPLLTMGHALCNDLDAMVRTVSRPRLEARLFQFTPEEEQQIKIAAGLALGWAASRDTTAAPASPAPAS